MPFIAPRFNTPVQRAPTPVNRPPWIRGPVPSTNNQQQENNGTPVFVPPWRKNIRRISGDPIAGNNSTIATPPPEVIAGQPQTSLSSVDSPTKTSSIQINLKSVKKPDPTPPPPQQQPISGTVLPPVGKVIAIPIAIQRENSSTPPVTTSIPIQIVKQQDLPKSTQKGENATMPKAAEGPPPPAPPAPPPPPPSGPPPPPLPAKVQKIEQLRKPAKKRPDWAGMMKEIEKGRRLNHVDCDDRSKPMISRLKYRGKFVYESEAKPATKSDAIHNRIMNEIQQGVKLKKVHCNDRSKPILTGLRVGRQSSVLEGETVDGVPAPLLDSVNQLAFLDIDDLRDELQSAKQLLQAEVETKHSLERKARDQKCQIISMEAEIETLKAKLGIIPEDEVSALAKSLEKSDSKTFKHLKKSSSSLWKSPSSAGLKKSRSGLAKQSPSDANVNKLDEDELNELNEYDEEIVSLKEAVQHAKQQADEMETKYKEAMAKLEAVQNNLENSEQSRKSLEKQLETLQAQQDGSRPLAAIVQTAERTTQTEEQILEKTGNFGRQQSTASNAGDDGASESEEEQESDMEVDDEAIQKKKQERELKLWENKVKSVKDKQNISRLERKNLKSLQKKLEAEVKDANKKHRKLQKEVDKMAKMLKDAEKEDDEEDEEEEEEGEGEDETEEEEESEEEEEESESEEEDNESSEEDDEDASYEDRLAVFGKRVKRRENVLNALRKGNYLLRANIDRLKDELEETRISYHDLEHELNSVLEEV